MVLGVWLIASWMLFMLLVGIAFFVWGWRSGQFHDVEASKRTMLVDREPEPWPRRAAGRRTAGRGGAT